MSPTFRKIRDYIRACPECGAVMPDSWLAALMHEVDSDDAWRAVLIGECWFRRLLYHDRMPESLSRVIDTRIEPELRKWLSERDAEWDYALRHRSQLHEIEASSSCPERLATYLLGRIHNFQTADGLIVLVASGAESGDEAVALPFKLEDFDPAALVRDLNLKGSVNEAWANERDNLTTLVEQKFTLQLQVVVGPLAAVIGGASYGVPVLLARHIKEKKEYPCLPALTTLATGRVEGGLIMPVDKLAAKADLAHRLGVALFAAPGARAHRGFELTVGARAASEVERLAHESLIQGKIPLTGSIADKLLEVLKADLHHGRATYEDALRRLEQCDDFVNTNPDSAYANGCRMFCALIGAALANHQGDPGRAAKLLAEAEEVFEASPALLAELYANWFVSLADQGELEEAENLYAKKEQVWCSINRLRGREKLRAKMYVAGAYGVQVLANLALHGKPVEEEAIDMAEEACRLAEELNDPPEVGRDCAQLLLVHALLTPLETEQRYVECVERMRRCGVSVDDPCRPFLRRARLLGAWRLCLNGGTSPANDWIQGEAGSVPEVPPRLNWLRATMLKYRASLYCWAGMHSRGSEDFDASWSLLREERHPLLRFIAGSIAAEAGECLLVEDRTNAEQWLGRAEEIFTEYADWQTPQTCGRCWLERIQGLRLGSPAVLFPNPQAAFPY